MFPDEIEFSTISKETVIQGICAKWQGYTIRIASFGGNQYIELLLDDNSAVYLLQDNTFKKTSEPVTTAQGSEQTQ